MCAQSAFKLCFVGTKGALELRFLATLVPYVGLQVAVVFVGPAAASAHEHSGPTHFSNDRRSGPST